MLNSVARWCFAATAISPALGAAAIIVLASDGPWQWALSFVIVGLLAIAISLGLLSIVRNRVEKETIEITDVEQADQKVLEFLLAYLLPVFAGTKFPSLTGSVAITVYSLLVVTLVVVHGNLFQFNPILAIFKYHFYIVTSKSKIKYQIISKQDFHKSERTLVVKKIDNYIYLDVIE